MYVGKREQLEHEDIAFLADLVRFHQFPDANTLHLVPEFPQTTTPSIALKKEERLARCPMIAHCSVSGVPLHVSQSSLPRIQIDALLVEAIIIELVARLMRVEEKDERLSLAGHNSRGVVPPKSSV
jgi:hypothetical protein